MKVHMSTTDTHLLSTLNQQHAFTNWDNIYQQTQPTNSNMRKSTKIHKLKLRKATLFQHETKQHHSTAQWARERQSCTENSSSSRKSRNTNVYVTEIRRHMYSTVNAVGLDWTEQCFTSPPTQYRLYGRRFLQVKRQNQQYQSTEGTNSTQTNQTHNKRTWTQNTASPLVNDNMGWLGDGSHRGQLPGLNGGGAAAAVPPNNRTALLVIKFWEVRWVQFHVPLST